MEGKACIFSTENWP